jgi:hypothetical protein
MDKLKVLVASCKFDDILPCLKKLLADEYPMLSHYKEAFDLLMHTEARPKAAKSIVISAVPVRKNSDEKEIIVENCVGDTWERCLARNVEVAPDLTLTKEEVVAHCLLALTEIGFSPEEMVRPCRRGLNYYEHRADELEKWLARTKFVGDPQGKELELLEERSLDQIELIAPNRQQICRNYSIYHHYKELIADMRRKSEIEDLILEVLPQNGFMQICHEDTKYLFSKKKIFRNIYRSRAFGKMSRLDYVKELMTKYETEDFSQYTDFIVVLATSDERNLLTAELMNIHEMFSPFVDKKHFHWGLDADEALREDLEVRIIASC